MILEKIWWNYLTKKQDKTFILYLPSVLLAKNSETDADSFLQSSIVVPSIGLNAGPTKLWTLLPQNSSELTKRLGLINSQKNSLTCASMYITQLLNTLKAFTPSSEERTMSLPHLIWSFWSCTSKWWNTSKVCFLQESVNTQSVYKLSSKQMKRSPNCKKKLLKCSLNSNNLQNKQLNLLSNSKRRQNLPMRPRPFVPRIQMKHKSREMRSMIWKMFVRQIWTRLFPFSTKPKML